MKNPQGREAASQSWVIHLGNSGMQVDNVLQSGIKLHWLLQTISMPPFPQNKSLSFKCALACLKGCPGKLFSSFLLESTSLKQEPEAPQFCFSHPVCEAIRTRICNYKLKYIISIYNYSHSVGFLCLDEWFSNCHSTIKWPRAWT